MHGLFGAMRLYVVAAGAVENHPAHQDDDSVTPFQDGAWAAWARKGESLNLVDLLPSLSRVNGVVHIAPAVLAWTKAEAIGRT